MMNQRGATIVESMICMLLLCMVLFGLLQIFQWTMAKMVCEYSSFYAAKASAYGFADTIVVNAGRVAATAASGQDTGSDKEPLQYQCSDVTDYRQKLAIRAQNYMVNSDTTINYAYWQYGQSVGNSAVLYIPLINNQSPTITATVSVLNMPLLDPGVSIFVKNPNNPEFPEEGQQFWFTSDKDIKARHYFGYTEDGKRITTNANIPAGTSNMYNHSLNYLDR